MREILFRAKAINRIDGRQYRTKYKNGDWVYGLIERLYDDCFPNIPATMRNTDGVSGIDIDYNTIGQYTGLTDKNGKKIFEGDILKGKHDWRNWNTSFGNDEKDFLEQKIRGAYRKCIDNTLGDIFKWRYCYFRNYAVEYYAPNGGYRVRNGGQFHTLTKNHIYNRDFEIIGNIHDNPDLLKGGDE
jgi:uncharacterized phage protein (TIGR01671 family)